MSLRITLKIIIVAGLSLATTAPGRAALVLQDQFLIGSNEASGEYNAGDIAGQEPDTLGFDAANDWSLSNADPDGDTSDQIAVVQASGLTFSTLDVAGGSVDAQNMDPNDANDFVQTTRSTQSLDPESNGTWYASVLMNRPIGESTGFANVNLTRNNNNGPFAFGIEGTQYKLQIRDGSDGDTDNEEAVGGTYTPGATTFLVLKVTPSVGGDELVELFIDPTSPTEPAFADLSVSDGEFWDGSTNLSGVQLRHGGNSGSAVFDEIRIGMTYEDVTPGLVPEPSALLILAIAGLALLVRGNYRTVSQHECGIRRC